MAYDVRKLFGARDGEAETLAVMGEGASAVVEPAADPAAARAAVEPGAEEAALREDRVVARAYREGVVTLAQVREAHNQWRRKGEQDALWRWLAEHPEVEREDVYGLAARVYAFPHADIGEGYPDAAFVKSVIEGLPTEHRDRMLALRLLPLERELDTQRGTVRLVFAAQDPTLPDTLRFLGELGVEHFDLRYAPESRIDPLLRELFPKRNEFLERMQNEKWAYDLGASFEQGQQRLVDDDAIEAEINRSGLINLFEASLVEAVRLGASDLHIWPNADRQTEFHLRIDGELQPWHTEDKVHPEALLSVVKDRAGNVDRFEREAAQDGYIQRTVDGTLIRYRVSILPIASANRDIKAESIVIRVLDDRKVFGDLSAIGLLPEALARFKKAVRQPHGMVIMTGPTGSGKSTTLVAALHDVIRPQVNVLSIEDPVEYVIRGVRQIKLGPRLGMERALRSVLRHDPDIVMVGEMRDRETAELAIKLANTGHLTFSTLHTNDAPSAVARLFKMGIEPFLIAYAINLVVAQRLLRTLCPACRVRDADPDTVLYRAAGFTDDDLATGTFYLAGERPDCPTCKGVGYRGRRAIAEALYFSRDVRHRIVQAGDEIDEDGLRDLAVAEGMLTLIASGREIVRLGQTSIDELLRVTATED